MGDSLTDKCVGVRHGAAILGFDLRQANKQGVSYTGRANHFGTTRFV
jgi:hypothetical protein